MNANNRGNPEIDPVGLWREGAKGQPEFPTQPYTAPLSTDLTPSVSVSMITYRHGPYVEAAILGVLMQETTFTIELVVSNDHSPDNTDDVIQLILLRHPRANRVRYIRHNQNLGIMANALHNLNQCRGAYIAFCEGDDCWTDPQKLQKQVEQLEKNPTADLCFHPAQTFFGRQNAKQLFAFQSMRQKRIPTDEVISGGGDFCPTASVMIRRDVFKNLEGFLRAAPVGDYFLQAMASIRGGAIYLPEPMCIYRRGIPFSWTADMEAIQRRQEFFGLILTSLKRFDELLCHTKSQPLGLEIERQYLHLSLTYLKHGMLGEYRALYETLNRKHSVSMRIKVLHKVGLRFGSEPLTRELDRWAFARPNPIARAIKRLAKAVYVMQSTFPKVARAETNHRPEFQSAQ